MNQQPFTPIRAAPRAEDREPKPASSVPTLAVLTLCWLSAASYLFLHWIAVGMRSWPYPEELPALQEQRIHHEQWIATLWFAGVLVCGPLVIAFVAAAGRRFWAAGVYAALAALLCCCAAVLLCCPAGWIAEVAYRQEHPPPAVEQHTTGGCQDLSGGDTRCPGG